VRVIVDEPATEESPTIDGIDLLFGLIPYGVTCAAVAIWGRVWARMLRGEEAKVPTSAPLVSGMAIAAWSYVSGTHVRQNIALGKSISEVGELLRETASDEIQRDQRNAARDDRVYKLTVAMAVLAGLTLAAAIATLVAATG
jgi:hypothetical protein